MRNQEWTGADPANVPLGQHLHGNARPSVCLTAELMCRRRSLVPLPYSVRCVGLVTEKLFFFGFNFYLQVQVFLEAVSYSLTVH